MGTASGPDPRRGASIVYALYLLFYLATLVRMLVRSQGEGPFGTASYALMTAFLALGAIQVPASRRRQAWTHVHLAAQNAVVTALFVTGPTVDFFAILLVQLSVVATRDLPERQGMAWIAILCAMVAVDLAIAYGDIGDVLGYIPVYVAACLILGLYGRATKRAEAAWARSEELLAALEEANARLKAYAEKAEEAAAAQERSRLARELHDAATQIVFGLNLTAEAARVALDRDPGRLPGLLDRIQELARDALAELRSLVRGPHRSAVASEGLVRSLERLAAAREKRDGLAVRLSFGGAEGGSDAAKETLYRAAVEALNNVGKHSGAAQAAMELVFGEGSATLRVSDRGAGFDASAGRRPESYGLVSLREEIEALGGSLAVVSAPGSGTELEVRLPLAEGEEGR